MEERAEKKKGHRDPHSGRKAEKKKSKKHNPIEGDAHKNPKAFAFNSAVKAARTFRRGQDIQSKKHHVPVVDRTPLEPPPILVAVVGPPKVGKSLLIQCLIKSFTRQPLATIKGPVTVVSGKKRRITFIECNNDINSMIDLAKICDLVLLLIDASFGFEMEIFEFLNICQVHGMPKIMGVLTHLDILKQAAMIKKVKKTLKHRFWTEVYAGAKLFYLSGILHGEYLRNEIKNLGRFISVMKFRPLIWQTTHPYLLADRMEDLTSPELIRQNNKVDRCISVYGYMRGIPLNKKSFVHIPGCGDFHIKDVSYLPDPCPLPEKLKKRALGEKERLIYAPFSGVGDIVYDKDGVYIEVRHANNNNQNKESNVEPVKELVSSLLETKNTLDSKIAQSELQIFSNAAPITASEFIGDVAVSNSPDGINVQRVNDNGRERRKVIFSDDINEDENNKMDVDEDDSDNSGDDNDMNKGSDDSDSNSDDDGDELKDKIKKSNKITLNNSNVKTDTNDDDFSGDDSLHEKGDMEEEEEDDDYNDDDGDEEEDSGVKWKSNLAQKATDAFLERQATSVNLWKLVYGDNNSINNAKQEEGEENNDGDDEGEGLFKIVKQKEEKKLLEKDMMNAEDCTARFSFTFNKPWTSAEICESIKDCFVTGKWKKSEDAFRLTENGGGMDYDDDDIDDEDICDGDFEDFETGEKHVAEKKDEPKDKSEDNGNKEVMTQKERLEKKKKLKERFNLEYDDDKEGDGKSYYDELKEEVTKQAEINRSQFEGLDDALRVQLEGFRAGLYVRIEFDSVPCELVNNFDPTYPVIVGSLQPGEENVGFVKARIKKHRWFERILKTNDPLIFSVGWRRFQTVPVYSKLEDNLRHRMLKYTPEHVACMVHFWGPLTRAGTGILAVQDVASRQPGFRIVVTGTVVDTNQSTEVTKKLKLTGVPFKIYKKTAFVQGMFNSTLEVAKFEGARIKTVSGIRGQIKKAVNKPEGAYRATFEDKLKLSDIVFCRTWYKVDIPKLYNPVTSLLLPISEKNTWQGMKTMWQLKKEHNVQNEPQKDSLYTEIKRQRQSFTPFRVPKKLQKELPYRDKPKNRYHINKKIPKPERVAVIRDVQEAKVASLMSKLKSNYKAKVRQLKRDMEKRVKEHRKTVRLEEMKKQRRQKEEKRGICKERTKKIAKAESGGRRNRRNEGD